MKCGDHMRDPVQIHPNVHPVFDEPPELAIVREPPHDNGGIGEIPSPVTNLVDSKVDVRREPAIQVDLLVASSQTLFRTPEVHERESHRLLAFAHDRTFEAEHRDVRLDGSLNS
jgi:hypothetical protein